MLGGDCPDWVCITAPSYKVQEASSERDSREREELKVSRREKKDVARKAK